LDERPQVEYIVKLLQGHLYKHRARAASVSAIFQLLTRYLLDNIILWP
jgi:hypothetical protein